MTIKKDFVVQKTNLFNEIQSKDMTLQELRFFGIYLSRINAQDVSTRIVRFSMSGFKDIMGLGHLQSRDIQKATDGLLCKIVNVPSEKNEGYTSFQIFKRCVVDQDEAGEWFVEIDAHDDALPLMFDFKDRFFSYKLWNVLKLKSPNQFRMYEILKQYQSLGYRILTIDHLKSLLGIDKTEYTRLGNFKTYVLNVCQKALAENTDITFSYEPHGKKGPKGKILTLKFIISENTDYRDPLSFDKFIKDSKASFDINDIDSDEADEFEADGKITPRENRIIFLRDAVNRELSIEQMQVLYDIAILNLPSRITSDDLKLYHHFMEKYNILKLQESKGNIMRSSFGYLKKIIASED